MYTRHTPWKAVRELHPCLLFYFTSGVFSDVCFRYHKQKTIHPWLYLLARPFSQTMKRKNYSSSVCLCTRVGQSVVTYLNSLLWKMDGCLNNPPHSCCFSWIRWLCTTCAWMVRMACYRCVSEKSKKRSVKERDKDKDWGQQDLNYQANHWQVNPLGSRPITRRGRDRTKNQNKGTWR